MPDLLFRAKHLCVATILAGPPASRPIFSKNGTPPQQRVNSGGESMMNLGAGVGLVGIRLLIRNGHDWASRYPLILQAVEQLKVRSCRIDGEAVCCNERGVASFDKL